MAAQVAPVPVSRLPHSPIDTEQVCANRKLDGCLLRGRLVTSHIANLQVMVGSLYGSSATKQKDASLGQHMKQ